MLIIHAVIQICIQVQCDIYSINNKAALDIFTGALLEIASIRKIKMPL